MLPCNIPIRNVRATSIAEGWERSMLNLYHNGVDIKTQYDKEDDPPSKDCTMIIEIFDPLSEPMIHKDFPGGLEDLQEYVMEVCDGIKDHCVRDPDDPDDKRWIYTYHQRLFDYQITETFGADGILDKACTFGVDQIEQMCQSIAKTPHTRRAQAITWRVREDPLCEDPPCLQSIFARCLEQDNILWLNMNIRIRSNDAYKAAFMNMFAFVMLMKKMAARIQEIGGREVRLGRYCHMADSYHLYGSYFKEFKERFMGALRARTFEDRTYRYEDVKNMMDEAIPAILEKAKNMK